MALQLSRPALPLYRTSISQQNRDCLQSSKISFHRLFVVAGTPADCQSQLAPLSLQLRCFTFCRFHSKRETARSLECMYPYYNHQINFCCLFDMEHQSHWTNPIFVVQILYYIILFLNVLTTTHSRIIENTTIQKLTKMFSSQTHHWG